SPASRSSRTMTTTVTDRLDGTSNLTPASDLGAIDALDGTGVAARTGSNQWALRTITGAAAGVSVANGNGAGGDPTLSLATDLAGLEALAGTGVAARTGTDAWAARTIAGTSNEVSVSNGDGAAGNPTIGLAATLALRSKGVQVQDNNFTI